MIGDGTSEQDNAHSSLHHVGLSRSRGSSSSCPAKILYVLPYLLDMTSCDTIQRGGKNHAKSVVFVSDLVRQHSQRIFSRHTHDAQNSRLDSGMEKPATREWRRTHTREFPECSARHLESLTAFKLTIVWYHTILYVNSYPDGWDWHSTVTGLRQIDGKGS